MDAHVADLLRRSTNGTSPSRAGPSCASWRSCTTRSSTACAIGCPKVGENHHAIRARRLAESVHEGRAPARHAGAARPSLRASGGARAVAAGVSGGRSTSIVKRIPDFPLFMRFVELDGASDGKNPEPIDWLRGELTGARSRRFRQICSGGTGAPGRRGRRAAGVAADAPRRARREALPWSAAAPPATVRRAVSVPGSSPETTGETSHPEDGPTRSSETVGWALAGAGASAPRRYSPSVENSTTVSSAAPNRSLSRGNMRSRRYAGPRTEGPLGCKLLLQAGSADGDGVRVAAGSVAVDVTPLPAPRPHADPEVAAAVGADTADAWKRPPPRPRCWSVTVCRPPGRT